jgi:hypothetical protein
MSKFKQEGSPLFGYRMRSIVMEIGVVSSAFTHDERALLLAASRIISAKADELSPRPVERASVDAPAQGRGAYGA